MAGTVGAAQPAGQPALVDGIDKVPQLHKSGRLTPRPISQISE
jgi:hypothetical protein